MPDESPQANGDPDDEGVFGKLPRARPGVRSPLRNGGKARAAPKRPAQRRAAPAAPADRPAPPPPPPSPPAGAPSGAESPERIGGIEDLAWAGIAVAAQAATVGVRAASRALEALRRSLDPED